VVCVVIPEGCRSIGAQAFANCASLRFVEFPDSVTFIDPTAFDGRSDTFVFVACEGSYALEYATVHQIPCVIK
jgi:hypothetical protein